MKNELGTPIENFGVKEQIPKRKNNKILIVLNKAVESILIGFCALGMFTLLFLVAEQNRESKNNPIVLEQVAQLVIEGKESTKLSYVDDVAKARMKVILNNKSEEAFHRITESENIFKGVDTLKFYNEKGEYLYRLKISIEEGKIKDVYVVSNK